MHTPAGFARNCSAKPLWVNAFWSRHVPTPVAAPGIDVTGGRSVRLPRAKSWSRHWPQVGGDFLESITKTGLPRRPQSRARGTALHGRGAFRSAFSPFQPFANG